MKQCFGYVRVSTLKQGEGVSLEAQKEAILEYARRNDIEIVRWFEEKVTAAKQGRPAFNAMVGLLKRGKALGLVVHKIDRSARNFADWARIGDLSDAGLDVHFASETLDFRSRGGRLSADIQAVIAADYVRNLREECLKGIRGRLRQGLCPWGAPIGYLNNGAGKPKTPDPERAPLIRELFRLYASGSHTIRSLQAEMRRLGLRNSRGRPLSKRGIECVLANPFYYGFIRVRSSGEVYKGVHQPLITAGQFSRIGQVKAGRRNKVFTRRNHTYRGLFQCALCSTSMIGERHKGRVYYRCHTSGCPTTTILESQIEARVAAELEKAALTDSSLSAALANLPISLSQEARDVEVAGTRFKLSQAKSRLDVLTDALLDRIIDSETFAARKASLLAESAQLEEKLERLSAPVDLRSIREFLELANTLRTLFLLADPVDKRQIVETTTSNRLVKGRTLYLEPEYWLRTIQETSPVPTCGRHRHNSRTRRLSKKQIEALIKAAESIEVMRLQRLVHPPARINGETAAIMPTLCRRAAESS